MNNNTELHRRIAELKAENEILRRDVAILGPENIKLCNALELARNEIARLTAPKLKRRPPKKNITGTYEDYLVREAMQIVTESITEVRQGKRKRKISERDAAIEADKRIRATAASAQAAGTPGPFSGLAPYQADSNTVHAAFRRGKRALGWVRSRQTKK